MDVPNQDIRGVSFDIFVYFFNYKLMCVSYKQTLYSLRSCIKTNLLLLLLLLLLVRVCAHQGKQGPWEHLHMCPTILKIFPPTLKVEFISLWTLCTMSRVFMPILPSPSTYSKTYSPLKIQLEFGIPENTNLQFDLSMLIYFHLMYIVPHA